MEQKFASIYLGFNLSAYLDYIGFKTRFRKYNIVIYFEYSFTNIKRIISYENIYEMEQKCWRKLPNLHCLDHYIEHDEFMVIL